MRDIFTAPELQKGRATLYGCRLLLAVCLLNIGIHASGAGNAASSSADTAVTEYQVKALYLYYFAKFVDWPQASFAAKNTPITVAILGDDAFAALVEQIAKNKTAQERPIAIRRLKWPADVRGCHILFISTYERRRLAQLSGTLQSNPILTVTETEEGLQDKGIMNLIMEGGKIQFEADMAAAEKAQLRISSKLLRMARGATGKILAKKE